MSAPNELPKGGCAEPNGSELQQPNAPSSQSGPEAEISQLSLEEALARLERIVRHLEEGEPSLDESLAQYEEGVRLLRHCYHLLEKAERRIELLAGVDAQGQPILQPFEDRMLTLEEKAQSRDLRRTAQSPPSIQPGPPSQQQRNSLPDSGGLF